MFTPARTPISLIGTALSPPALIAPPQRAEACGDTVFDTKVNTIIYDQKTVQSRMHESICPSINIPLEKNALLDC